MYFIFLPLQIIGCQWLKNTLQKNSVRKPDNFLLLRTMGDRVVPRDFEGKTFLQPHPPHPNCEKQPDDLELICPQTHL